MEDQNPYDVDVVFVMDSTASMGRYIQDVKEHISEMAEDIVDEFRNCTGRVGFVGYRDFTEGDKRLEILDMTNKTSEFVDFVDKIRAYAGGDVPEDVLGGLNQALDLSWKAKNRIIFHIGTIPIMLVLLLLVWFFQLRYIFTNLSDIIEHKFIFYGNIR